VEEQFQTKLSAIGDGAAGDESPDAVPLTGVVLAGGIDAGASEKTSTTSRKSPRIGAVRTLGKTVRLRDKDHLKFVSRQPCLVCGRAPSDPHHLRFTQARALGRRVSDEFTVPLCRIHHRELHRQVDEAAWWARASLDPLPVALRLWQHTRLNGVAAPLSGPQPCCAAQTPDMSVQDHAGASSVPRVNVQTSVADKPDGL